MTTKKKRDCRKRKPRARPKELAERIIHSFPKLWEVEQIAKTSHSYLVAVHMIIWVSMA